MSNFPSIMPFLQAAAVAGVEKEDPKSIAQQGSGLEQTPLLTEPNPSYLIADAETVMQGKCGSIIIQGRDRPGSLQSGTGSGLSKTNIEDRLAQPGLPEPKGVPVSHAACIDLIAGLSGVLKREVNAAGAPVLTNKSTELDCSRIYMTQLAADIDSKEYFNIARGSDVGPMTNRGAIVIKSDLVRVVGREGIKIVTGTDVFQGSRGMNVSGTPGRIDLIAGNNDAELEPMVKGDTLVTVLDKTTDLIDDLQSSVYFNLELITFLMFSVADPSGISQARLKSLQARIPAAYLDLWSDQLNFEFHKANYGGKMDPELKKIYNPVPKFNFRSKHCSVN